MKKILPVIVLILLSLNAFAQIRSDAYRKPSRKSLETELARLKSSLDSMQLVIDSLRQESIAAESAPADPEMGSIVSNTGYSAEQEDSLLSLWYHNAKARYFDSVHDYDMDSVSFTTDIPDSVMIGRLASMNSYITLPFNENVRNYMVLYAEKMPTRMGQMLGLGKYYFPMIEEALVRYELPVELKYLAIVESMLNPTATSRAGAKGMWQFMYRTARSYGLVIDSFVDERLDVEKSVDAAARYLKDAYRTFGDWTLAISSYNCGAGNVFKAIRRAGGNRDFWSIFPYLPRETRGYMPAFVGAMYAMTYYKEYGIVPQEMGMPAHTDTMHITRKLHFAQINEVVGVPMDELRNLNPQYVHEIIPGRANGPCVLNLPFNWTSAFLAADVDSLYNHRLGELMSDDVLKAADSRSEEQRMIYKVRSGDYLGRIASRYGVSVTSLKKWNNLKSTNLRVGQILYIYKNSGYIPPKVAQAGGNSASKMTQGGTYTVLAGDSFYTIAQKFPGISAQNIMDFNGIQSSKLRPGMVLKIPKI